MRTIGSFLTEREVYRVASKAMGFDPVKDHTAAQAFVKGLITNTAGGNSMPPASSGTGSPSSGNNDPTGSGSSGNGGGEYGTSDLQAGEPMDQQARTKAVWLYIAGIVVVVTILALGYGALINAAHKSTTPEGRAHSQHVANVMNEMDKRRHEEEMKKLDIKEARIKKSSGGENRQRQAEHVRALACTGPPSATSQDSPHVFTGCLEVGAGDNKYWIVFPRGSEPRIVNGTVWFRHPKNGGGKLDFCIANDSYRHSHLNSPDQCRSWLQERAGKPIMVDSRGSIKIHT